MIDINTLSEADKGREVKYKPASGSAVLEYGRITSWNERYIFVAYSEGPNGMATRPEDLEWA